MTGLLITIAAALLIGAMLVAIIYNLPNDAIPFDLDSIDEDEL